MRPVRIELEGFSAYRSRVEVDLRAVAGAQVALFSLSGATGAGKSSLIDAMIFALYGRIPRLGAREVAPVISAGTDRARVLVDFEVDGVVYTAVRLAQRTPSGGASVREARLQLGEQVLASGADNVTNAVEELLSLGFDDFTRTVVLPQGKFSRFLEAAPKEKQDLLRDLLGLEVYGRVRDLATGRKAVAEDRASSASSRLEALDVPEEAAVEAASSRFRTLEEMTAPVAEQEKALVALTVAVDDADKEVERLEDAVGRLDELDAPEGLEELGELVIGARNADADARDALDRAIAAVVAVETELQEGPDAENLALARKAHSDMGGVTEMLAVLDGGPAQAAQSEAEAELTLSKTAVDGLREQLDGLRVTHAAHALGAILVLGEPCPVCHHPVATLPVKEPPAELTNLETDIEAAEAHMVQSQKVLDMARAAVTEIETKRSQLVSRCDELAALIAAGPDRDELARTETLAEELKRRHAEAKAAVVYAESVVKETGKVLEELASRENSIGRLYKSALLPLARAGLDPPVSESDDTVVQWKDLLAWRETIRHHVVDDHEMARERATTARAADATARQTLVEDLVAAGLAPIEPYTATLAGETERARQLVTQHEKAIADGAALREQIETDTATAAVAAALVAHLRADGFERWMMAGALHTLVVGANSLLADLSDGGYSLHSAKGTFTVIDHRNADERRPVSTLSGGETFLVSLALSLSLAETLAGSGGARLDAIILDEGFGTLDDESLDTVASVLEELAGQGLMVGVITHVKELAARATVRYEVTRSAKGSTVREVA